MQRGKAMLCAAVALAALAGCGTTEGVTTQPATGATTAPAASSVPTPSNTGTYNVPPPLAGCPHPEPLLGGHCSGEAVSVPACLTVTSEQVAAALGYKGNVLITGER